MPALLLVTDERGAFGAGVPGRRRNVRVPDPWVRILRASAATRSKHPPYQLRPPKAHERSAHVARVRRRRHPHSSITRRSAGIAARHFASSPVPAHDAGRGHRRGLDGPSMPKPHLKDANVFLNPPRCSRGRVGWGSARRRAPREAGGSLRSALDELERDQHGELADQLEATEPAESGRPGRIPTDGKPQSGAPDHPAAAQRRPTRSDNSDKRQATTATSDKRQQRQAASDKSDKRQQPPRRQASSHNALERHKLHRHPPAEVRR